jgi:hypothetical protein
MGTIQSIVLGTAAGLYHAAAVAAANRQGKRVLNWAALTGSLGNRDLHTIAPASRDTRVSRQGLGRYLSKAES